MKETQIERLYRQYRDGMQDWQIKLAIARMLHFKLPADAWEDAMQELAIVVHQFRFDPEKSGKATDRTILCRRMDNCIRMLARGNGRHLAMLGRLEKMTQDTQYEGEIEQASMPADIAVVINQLPPLQQQICHGLMQGLSVPQIARALHCHHMTVGRHIGHIRQAFVQQGFDACPA